MIIERVETVSALRSLEHEWRALERHIAPLPFVTFDWVESWWTHLHADRLAVKDELLVYVFRETNGSVSGIAPLMRTRRPSRGPLQLRHVQFLGADPNITEIRTLAAVPERVPRVINALLDDFRADPYGWDLMQLTGVPAEHAGSIDLDRFANVEWTRDVPNYYLELPSSWAEFRSTLPRNIKESLRKCYNAPKRAGLTFTPEVVTAPELVAAAVSDLLRLHELRARRDDTVRHSNVFAESAARDFLADYCERLARRERLCIFQLRHGEAVIAARLGFRCGDSLYLYYSGYDPSYGRYSVMTTVVAEAIKFAIANGFRSVNLSTGSDQSKLRWNPRVQIYREASLVSPSLRGAVAHDSYAWVRRTLDRRPATNPLAAYLHR
jgi:CelD/BcsL family acetyltransferase involved in cellulose biosynthesis